jgi:hypothetical protein
MSKFVGCVAALAILIAAPVSAAPKNPVKVTSAKAVQGTQQVVIGQVTIGFLIERKDSAKAGRGGGGRSTVRSTLNGYTPADLQAIADAAHSDLEAKLKQAGFEVTDRAALAAHPKFAGTKPQTTPYEMSVITGRDDKAKVLFVPSSQSAPLRLFVGDAVVGGFSAMGLVMSGNQVTMGASDFAKATGIRVVNAVYYVDFADSEEYGGWFRSSSAVKVNGSLALLPDQSKLTLIAPNYKSATLALADPVAVAGDFFEAENTTTSGQKASQTVANVIGILGGVGTNSNKRMSFTARPGTYVPGAKQATADANSLLVNQLAALR